MKLGMEHCVLKLYKVYINDVDLDLFYGYFNSELTMTYFLAISNWIVYTFEWGNCNKVILWGKLVAKDSIERIIMLTKKTIDPVGCLTLPRSYIHVYDHHFQISFSLKPLGQSKPNSM